MSLLKNHAANVSTGGSSSSLAFEGFNEMAKLFDQLPDKIQKKVVVTAFKKGGNKFKKDLRTNTPKGLRKMNKSLSAKANKGRVPGLRVGYFANKGTYTNNRGVSWDLYQLIYWSNYGTGANRSSSHTFKKKRTKLSAHWKGGIIPKMFVEKAWEAAKETVTKTVESELKNETEKILKQYAIR